MGRASKEVMGNRLGESGGGWMLTLCFVRYACASEGGMVVVEGRTVSCLCFSFFPLGDSMRSESMVAFLLFLSFFLSLRTLDGTA